MTSDKNKFASMLRYTMLFCPTLHHPIPTLLMLLKAFSSYECVR